MGVSAGRFVRVEKFASSKQNSLVFTLAAGGP